MNTKVWEEEEYTTTWIQIENNKSNTKIGMYTVQV